MIKLINFINLTDHEKEIVLKWRNHKIIREKMFNNEIILKQVHFKFIEKLKKDNKNRYFLVKNNENIGVIYFNDITKNKANIGLYVNPNLKGIGKILMQEIISYGFSVLKLKRLILEVFENNQKAINLYKKFGFKEIKRKDNFLIMEYRSEDR